jgi:hypothetical protein
MKGNALVMLAAAAAACSMACNNNSAPLAPAPAASASPSLSTPAPQSPINGQVLSGLSATLTATAATSDIASYVPQYRFQVFSDTSLLVQDSGLVASPSWTTTVTLTPNAKHTWKVRAESQGFSGAWSSAASFTTPDQPPAYRGQIGNWQACAGRIATDLVTCVWNTIYPTDSVGDLEVVKRVAWLLRGDGAGLLIKNSGDNVVLWQGYSLSASRICFADGHIYKIIGDAGPGGANSPGFADNGFVDLSLYVPAIDPSKP